MMKLIPVAISFLVVALFLYSKLLPHKDKLDQKYLRLFDFFNKIFLPVLDLLKKVVKPFKVGAGISVDMTQLVLLVIFLIFLNSF